MTQIDRRMFLSGISASLLPIGIHAENETFHTQRVYLENFGLVPGVEDAEPAFREAIARLPARGGILVVPQGNWRFARKTGVAIALRNRDNVAIEGFGATLLFSEVARPLVFQDCVAPSVRGLTIDWDRAPFSQGEVIDVSPNNLAAVIRIEAEFPVDGSEPIEAVQTMEPGTLLLARGGVDAYKAVVSSRLLADQVLRLYFSRPLSLRAGDFVILRHKLYEAPLVVFDQCRDVSVEDVTLHAGPGMGIVALGCEGGEIRRLVVSPRANSSRAMSLNADGIHLGSCRGKVVIEDCLLRGMGDDGVNVHNKYYVIQELFNTRTVRIGGNFNTFFGKAPMSTRGDVFDISTRAYSIFGKAILVDWRKENEDIVLEFDRDLPLEAAVGALVVDSEARTVTTIRRCRFPGNRARGVLAHADATIEDCHFAGHSGPAVLFAVGPPALEGPQIAAVKVQRNEVSDACRKISGGAVTVETLMQQDNKGPVLDPEPIGHDVSISGNTFSEITGSAISASSVDGVRISDNRIKIKSTSAISLAVVKNVLIDNNVCTPMGKVICNDTDKLNIVLSHNRGLSIGDS